MENNDSFNSKTEYEIRLLTVKQRSGTLKELGLSDNKERKAEQIKKELANDRRLKRGMTASGLELRNIILGNN